MSKTNSITRHTTSSTSRANCSVRWWYIARVKNSSGIHEVFYSTTRPVVGLTCPGVAAPNQIVGYRRELAYECQEASH